MIATASRLTRDPAGSSRKFCCLPTYPDSGRASASRDKKPFITVRHQRGNLSFPIYVVSTQRTPDWRVAIHVAVFRVHVRDAAFG